ncbi:hypothetical protein L218DRAFT_991992 [Marasmius fiardii PR-910]|nr:hypothetical protein L218DRAFT_991992 [Marasmius fiardii PR-910]
MSKNTTDDSANAVSPMLTTVAVQSGSPSTPRPSQASRTTRYPAELNVQSHHPHRYEGFEELLREAGYKETRIYTPERERVTNKSETVRTGDDDAKRGVRGDERAETTKLRSMVGFLAGFLVSVNSERREDHGEHGHNEATRHTSRDTVMESPSRPTAARLPSSPSSAGSSSQSVVASPPNILPLGTPQQTHAQSDMHMHTPTLTHQSRSNFVYSQSNASYSSITSALTATQPKYLRSAHIQHRRQGTDSQQKTNAPNTSNRRRHSEMLPPPVPPVPLQYQNRTHQASPSKPTTPSHTQNLNRPTTSTQSRPTTPTPHQAPPIYYSRPGSRNQNHALVATHSPHLRPTQTEPLPGSQNPAEHLVPSKAHAYLRRMASVQKIFDESGPRVAPSDAENSELWTQGEEEDTPRPKYRSTPGPVFRGVNLWSSFTSTTSSNSLSSSCASHSTSATSPQTGSRLYQEDEDSEPDEENGGYFNLIRSRSQSRTRREMDLRGIHHHHVRASRTVESGEEENPRGTRWWGLRQTKSMVHVKVQEEDESLTELGVKRRKSAITVSNLGSNAMVDSTNLVAPVPSRTRTSPALPYLVTRLSSPALPDAAEYSRGRVQEKKTRVYCRSQSLPRRRKSGRGRWGPKELSDQEPVPILVPNTSDTESIDDQDHANIEVVSNSMERYLSGWSMDINTTFLSPRSTPGESSTSLTTTTHRSPPRQNSIRSLKRHLKRDADMEQKGEEFSPVPALTRTAGRGRGKDRGGLPGGWLIG